MLYRIIYVSRMAENVDLREARRILSVSQTNNPRRAVTGALVFNSGHFVQWLEGARREVSELFTHIAKDPRHVAVELLDFSRVSRREFADWSMGYIGEGVLNKSLFASYAPGAVFDPYELNEAAAVEFVREAAGAALRLNPPAGAPK